LLVVGGSFEDADERDEQEVERFDLLVVGAVFVEGGEQAVQVRA